MKLQRLRELMTKHKIKAYFVPRSNPHMSENLTPADERLNFISGFSGSAGHALITMDRALLWTDGRYWKQAEIELGITQKQLETNSNSQNTDPSSQNKNIAFTSNPRCDWTLVRQGEPDEPDLLKWIKNNLCTDTNETMHIGMDPTLITNEGFK